MATVAIGGICAVGFADHSQVAVGSHSGLGIFDARTGERLVRVHDEDYGWLRDEPPMIVVPGPGGPTPVSAAGLWGGELPTATEDGWTCVRVPDGVALTADGQADVTIRDFEEPLAFGFSPDGRVFVSASSSTLTIYAR